MLEIFTMKIEDLIKIGESETIEFKESTGEWKEIIEAISGVNNKSNFTDFKGNC